jgi:hypothetical protein
MRVATRKKNEWSTGSGLKQKQSIAQRPADRMRSAVLADGQLVLVLLVASGYRKWIARMAGCQGGSSTSGAWLQQSGGRFQGSAVLQGILFLFRRIT